MNQNYHVLEMKTYPRKEAFERFSNSKCSVSMTGRIDVTDLVSYCEKKNLKFYVTFLYLLSKVLNSKECYRCYYDWEKNEVRVYDEIHPMHYIFHEETESCSVVYTEFHPDFEVFYESCMKDIKTAKEHPENLKKPEDTSNFFDASYIPFFRYDEINIELPDGYLYFAPIINWTKYKEENGRLMMPLSVRMNHAIADGYHISMVFVLLEKEIRALTQE